MKVQSGKLLSICLPSFLIENFFPTFQVTSRVDEIYSVPETMTQLKKILRTSILIMEQMGGDLRMGMIYCSIFTTASRRRRLLHLLN